MKKILVSAAVALSLAVVAWSPSGAAAQYCEDFDGMTVGNIAGNYTWYWAEDAHMSSAPPTGTRVTPPRRPFSSSATTESPVRNS